MRWIRDYAPDDRRHKILYRNALIITLLGNVLLASGKATAAYISGSVALYADAANSISDVLYSVLVVFGLYIAQQPPDISHPQGHSRFEPLMGLVISLSMAYAGFEALRASYERFSMGGMAIEVGLPTVVLLLSAAVKAGMFASISQISRSLHSPTLEAAAQDNLADVLTSTAAFVGTLGSAFIHPLLDPLAGFVVAFWIFRAVWNVARENLRYLTGAGASLELRQQIVKEAQEVPGVVKVHHAMVEYVGPRLVADLHVNVDGDQTMRQAHLICDEVTRKLEMMPEIDRAYVHLEPDDWDE